MTKSLGVIESLTEWANEHMTAGDKEELTALIGTNVFESDERSKVDDAWLLRCEDGQLVHPDMINIKQHSNDLSFL
jgi:hypothetical protein